MLLRVLRLLAGSLTLAVACSDGPRADAAVGDCVSACSEGPEPAGLIKEEGGWTLRTPEIELAPAEERFVCFTATIPQKLAIRRFSSGRNPMVHHTLLVQALSPEPEGLSECDVLFKLTWAPLYPATTADSEIVVPEGSAKILDANSQVVLQMHLLNTSAETMRGQLAVRFDDATARDPTPVGITLFGDANFRLDPMKPGVAEHTCTLERDAALYAILPHMHYLGRRLELEVEEGGIFETVYTRETFDFDNQYVDPFERTLEAGTRVRIRCEFENDTNETVKFGESSRSEMCVAVGFRVGGQYEFDLCTNVPDETDPGIPHDPSAGVCGEQETAEGLGRRCTLGGDECPAELFCAADLLSIPDGFCFEVGCTSSDQCADSVCCTLPVLGDFANLCVPEYCRPDYCVPIESQAP